MLVPFVVESLIYTCTCSRMGRLQWVITNYVIWRCFHLLIRSPASKMALQTSAHDAHDPCL